MPRPLILLSNDDGYRADGIKRMREALLVDFDVVLCAPDNEQSASSHSLSLNRPLRLDRHGPGIFSVDGTPADSIYVALHADDILPRPPDLVISGMNHGLNLGQDVFYSGTVAAAREGALQGMVALAFSASSTTDLSAATRDAAHIALDALSLQASGPRLLNVNYPPGDAWQKCVTTSGRRVYSGGLVGRSDPRGRPYYWIGGDGVSHQGSEGTDTAAFDEGKVGITALRLDLSAPDGFPFVQALCERVNGRSLLES